MARALSVVVVVILIVVFAAINWSAFTAPTRLSFVVTTVDAPIGLVMLGLVVILSVLFTTWAIALQATAMLEMRRHTKELQAQRELADKAEASRFVDLRSFLAIELQGIAQTVTGARTDLLARVDHLEGETRSALDDAANSLSAMIGELDDRLQRGGGPSL